MSEALGTTTGSAFAPPVDPDTYRFDDPGRVSFQSVLDDVAAPTEDQPQAQAFASRDQEARGDQGHGPADSLQPPPDQPPSGSGPTPPPAPARSSIGASIAWGGCVAEHTAVGAAKGAVIGAVSGAVIGAGYGAAGGAGVGTVVAPGVGTLGGAAAGAAAGAVTGTTAGAADGASLGSAAGLADGLTRCADTSPPLPTDHIQESRADPGLTQPTGPSGGKPTGIRSTTEAGADAEGKVQVDSENQVADRTASAGYPTVQSPTKDPNPPLTPERMMSEGLKPEKNPDLLLSNRVFDTYTPVVDGARSVRNGIADKVEDGQTRRVVVDLRQTTQTEPSVRAALRNSPIPGLKEVIILTDDGLGKPFRP